MTSGGAAVEVRDNTEKSRFEIYVGDALAGFAQYRPKDGAITFTHTVIEEEFEGKGLGSQLARGALDSARARGLVVTPLCPFISRYIRLHPDYADIVDPRYRARS
jgi:uncharacterized protein